MPAPHGDGDGDGSPRAPAGADAAPARTEAELLAAGFERCFVADEPRLSEAVATYREIGFEVVLLPYRPDLEGACSECVQNQPGRCFVIYTRRAGRPRG